MTLKRVLVLLGALVWSVAVTAVAEDFATAKEAEAMVIKAVAAIKANKAKTLEEITNKDSKWVVGDLYPVVYDLQGKVLALSLIHI